MEIARQSFNNSFLAPLAEANDHPNRTTAFRLEMS